MVDANTVRTHAAFPSKGGRLERKWWRYGVDVPPGHRACLAKSVSQTGRCPTCQTSTIRSDDEISLARAVAEGNIAEVRSLLEQGIQHSPRDLIDSTPLLQAARQGHPKVIQLLLEHGASVLELDRYR